MANDLVGLVVSHYKITAQIGFGGMGVVYRGEDTRLGRPVAIKFVKPDMLDGAGALQRFQREARAASSLNHPNICTVYDVGEYEGQPFLVMEYLDGDTLAHQLSGKALPIDRAIDLVIEVSDALDAAHQRGIIHRDVKPANVFVTSRRQAKLLDFGLAKETQTSRAAASPAATMVTAAPDLATGTGSTLGTVAYMSPEQAKGETLDARTDVFSLGVMLYEMTTGAPPFTGPTPAVIFDGILNRQPVPPRQVNAAVPADLERIILRSLEKDRDLRYQTAADLCADLKRQRRSGDSSSATTLAASSRVPARRRNAAMVAVGIAAIVLLAAGYLVWQRTSSPGADSVTLKQVTNSGRVTTGTVSPDGKYIAFVESRDEKYTVFVHQVATGTSLAVLAPGENDFFGLTFSPDSSYVYAATRGSGALIQVPSLGGPTRKILDDVRGPIAFSPDGRRFAFATFDAKSISIKVADADGGALQALLVRPSDNPIGRRVSWSPDGHLVAASARGRLVFVEVAGGAEHTTDVAGWDLIESVNWLPSNRGLVVTAEPLEEVSARHQILEVTYPGGQIRRLTNDLNDYHNVTVSSDGRALASVALTVRSSIWTTTLASPDAAKRIAGGLNDGAQGLAWTADGRIAYADQTSVGWIMHADGTGVQPLSADRRRMRLLARCGQGPRLAFAVPRGNLVGLFLVDPDGGTPQKITDAPAGLAPFPACTPDGQWLVYTAARNLMKIPTAGGAASVLIQQAHEGRVSPDGTLIAAHKDEGGQEKMALFSMANGSLVRTLPGEAVGGFQWQPDGSALIVRAGADGLDNFFRLPIDGSARVQISHFTATDSIFLTTIHPDGRIAFSRGESNNDVVFLKLDK